MLKPSLVPIHKLPFLSSVMAFTLLPLRLAGFSPEWRNWVSDFCFRSYWNRPPVVPIHIFLLLSSKTQIYCLVAGKPELFVVTGKEEIRLVLGSRMSTPL